MNAARALLHSVVRLFGRFAVLVLGSIMMIAGLAMTATIVMLPAGVVVGLLGVGVFVTGLFIPA